MKLLIDQNLSRRLPGAIADLFPGSVHVRDWQMARSPDTEIWEYARKHGFVIATKDAWSYQRCLVDGPPPQVIWIRAGNCPARRVEELLRHNAVRLQKFFGEEQRAFIALV